jgi:small subunit ribosomal protein S2
VAILDTNCDPDLVDFPIPANDDAIRSIKVILNAITGAVSRGRAEHDAKFARAPKPEDKPVEEAAVVPPANPVAAPAAEA